MIENFCNEKKEQLAIDRRRFQELKRRERIFDSRIRQIGVNFLVFFFSKKCYRWDNVKFLTYLDW